MAVILAEVEPPEIGDVMKKRNIFSRLMAHMLTPVWLVKNMFSKESMNRIEKAIKESEHLHNGQICFVVETNLDLLEILHGKSGRKRALEVFSQLRIWDTEKNNGVLIYLLLADHDFEIVADRGIHQCVGNAIWEFVSDDMEVHFKRHQFEQGVLHGIEKITELMQQYYPPQLEQYNELPNSPVVL